MRKQGCEADAVLYNALLDLLWDTGVASAQMRAAALCRAAGREGHLRKLPRATSGPQVELVLQVGLGFRV